MMNRLRTGIFASCLTCGLFNGTMTAESLITAESEKSVTPKVDSPIITFMPDGGWCWYQDPRALIHHGKLILAGLSGRSGDVKISVYDLEAGKNLGTVVLHEKFERDDHDVPALYARPDGSILAMYAKHAKENVHYYRISDPEDYMKWGPEQRFVHDFKHQTGVTYMNLYYMKDQGLLYNFFRDGPTFNPSFMTSADHGDTWGNRTHFIADGLGGRNRPYARYLQRDANTVGVSFTEGHPRNYGNSLYYADFRNGAFYKVDGTKIKDLAAGPLLPSDAEKIYLGAETWEKPKGSESVPNSAWTCAAAIDSHGFPHLGYTVYLSDSDHRFRLATWNGTTWDDREIAHAGKCLYQKESSYTGLMAFDPESPERIVISSDVDPTNGKNSGGVHEIYAADVGLKGSVTTIQWSPLTAGSRHRQIRPIFVAAEGYKVLLWLSGPWNTYIDYQSDAVGMILDRPVKK